MLTRLITLNHERAAEETRGLIRYLRPDYQNPASAATPPVQSTLAGTEIVSALKTENLKLTTPAWPDRLPDQVALLRKLFGGYDKSVVTPVAEAEALSALFGRKSKKRTVQIEGILETLKGLGQL